MENPYFPVEMCPNMSKTLEAGQGDFIHLHGPEGFQQAGTMAQKSIYRSGLSYNDLNQQPKPIDDCFS